MFVNYFSVKTSTDTDIIDFSNRLSDCASNIDARPAYNSKKDSCKPYIRIKLTDIFLRVVFS